MNRKAKIILLAKLSGCTANLLVCMQVQFCAIFMVAENKRADCEIASKIEGHITVFKHFNEAL